MDVGYSVDELIENITEFEGYKENKHFLMYFLLLFRQKKKTAMMARLEKKRTDELLRQPRKGKIQKKKKMEQEEEDFIVVFNPLNDDDKIIARMVVTQYRRDNKKKKPVKFPSFTLTLPGPTFSRITEEKARLKAVRKAYYAHLKTQQSVMFHETGVIASLLNKLRKTEFLTLTYDALKWGAKEIFQSANIRLLMPWVFSKIGGSAFVPFAGTKLLIYYALWFIGYRLLGKNNKWAPEKAVWILGLFVDIGFALYQGFWIVKALSGAKSVLSGVAITLGFPIVGASSASLCFMILGALSISAGLVVIMILVKFPQFTFQ